MILDFPRAAVMAVMVASVLAACAPQKTVSTTYQKSLEDECNDAALSQQYMVKYEDGSMGVVKAASEQDFLDNYLAKNLARVKYAEPDYRVHAAMLANSVHVISTRMNPARVNAARVRDEDSPPAVDNWGVIRVSPDGLWQQNIRGQGIIVAVVDSGMDLSHPQLAKQVAVNAGEIGTDHNGHDRASNGIDDDGNGFVDDVYGWDFTVDRPLTGDNIYHGTHVSGIIAAAHTDTSSAASDHVEGIAPSAKLLPVAFLGSDGSGDMSAGIAAIQYAAQRGARVINASWGGTMCSQNLRDVIAGLESRGVIIVVAAGNEASNVDVYPEYPASLNLASQITVGATGDHDYMAEYSNFGDRAVHIFAPGSDIVSTMPGGELGSLSGTSMATPFVAGSIALLLSAEPSAKVGQIRQALYNTSVKRNDYINASKGRTNLSATLVELRRLMGK